MVASAKVRRIMLESTRLKVPSQRLHLRVTIFLMTASYAPGFLKASQELPLPTPLKDILGVPSAVTLMQLCSLERARICWRQLPLISYNCGTADILPPRIFPHY